MLTCIVPKEGAWQACRAPECAQLLLRDSQSVQHPERKGLREIGGETQGGLSTAIQASKSSRCMHIALDVVLYQFHDIDFQTITNLQAISEFMVVSYRFILLFTSLL